jgi:hypothetical protein
MLVSIGVATADGPPAATERAVDSLWITQPSKVTLW